jgi:hypothetical protein
VCNAKAHIERFRESRRLKIRAARVYDQADSSSSGVEALLKEPGVHSSVKKAVVLDVIDMPINVVVLPASLQQPRDRVQFARQPRRAATGARRTEAMITQ